MFKWFQNRQLNKKMILVNSVIILMFSGCWVFLNISFTKKYSARSTIATERANNCLRVINGINHSLSGLRGWMLLGNEKYLKERAYAWGEEIDPSFKRLQESLSKDLESISKIQNLDIRLEEFKKHQEEIEAVANTLDNNPALKILILEAAPKAKELMKDITEMIEVEKSLEATAARKNLLGNLADIRGSTASSLASIRAFLLTGDKRFQDEFNVLWQKNIKSLDTLGSKMNLLTARQNSLFQDFSSVHDQFKVLPPKMFKTRSSEDWNKANYLLKTNAAPLAESIRSELLQIFKEQSQIAKEKTQSENLTFEGHTNLSWLLLVGCLISTFIIALLTAKQIYKPLKYLASKLFDISNGNYQQDDLRIENEPEMTQLANAVNTIKNSYVEKLHLANDVEVRKKALEETVFEVLISLNEQGDILSMNKAGLELFGYSEDQLINKSEKILLYDSYSKEAEEAQQSFLNCLDKNNEIQIKLKDGKILSANSNTTKLKLPHGQCEYVTAIKVNDKIKGAA